MLKKLILIIFPLLLISCQENDKIKVQELLDKQNYIEAKKVNERLLSKYPLDPYYNGAMAYIVSVECYSTKCVAKNNNIKDIKQYLSKANGLAKVDTTYFIDFYVETINNLIKIAESQDNVESAGLVLKDFVNPTNKRTSYIYKKLLSNSLENLLALDSKKANFNLDIISNLNFSISHHQRKMLDLIKLFNENTAITSIQNELSLFDSVIKKDELPQDLLMILPAAIVNYAKNKELSSVVDIFNKIEEKNNLFGKELSFFENNENKVYFAEGLSKVVSSKELNKVVAEQYSISEKELVSSLQNISLRLNTNNPTLWIDYAKNIIDINQINKLYKGVRIEDVPSQVIVQNNNTLLEYATNKINNGSIIPILNEMVFREDSNKELFTDKTIAIVEKALKIEIDNDNLAGIFLYLNYLPNVKDKFKEELVAKTEKYIELAWYENNFDYLDKLIELQTGIKEVEVSDVLSELFESYLLADQTQIFFKSDNIQTLIDFGVEENPLTENIQQKYSYVKSKLKPEDLQTVIFSVARKLDGLYTQSKLFIYFSELFSESKVNTLIFDSIKTSIHKDQEVNLIDLANLGSFMLNKFNSVEDSFIKEDILSKVNSLDDVSSLWVNSSKEFKKQIIKANTDIENLMTAILADEENNKIKAAKFINKIKDEKLLSFIDQYNKIYKSYVEEIKGYYIKQTGEIGPEVIKLSDNKDLLKVKIDFISRVGEIEKLNKYQLNRGDILSKDFVSYYNPISQSIELNEDLTNEEKEVFSKAGALAVNDDYLLLGKNRYTKVNNLFKSNVSYGVVEQLTEKTKDNFHLLPEGSSFKILSSDSKNEYNVLIKHPATNKEILVKANYNEKTLDFNFEYDYFIKMLNKKYTALVKCQILDSTAYCALQDKNWKREKFSVLIKAVKVE